MFYINYALHKVLLLSRHKGLLVSFFKLMIETSMLSKFQTNERLVSKETVLLKLSVGSKTLKFGIKEVDKKVPL